MTVRELIQKLEALPGTDLVVLSRDAEGNDFSPVAIVEGVAETWDPKRRELVPANRKGDVVVLWPV